MSMIKTPEQIALMREAGRVVANTLAAVREAAAVGVTLRDLDALAAETIADGGSHTGLPGLPPALGRSSVSRGDLHSPSTTPSSTASPTGTGCRTVTC